MADFVNMQINGVPVLTYGLIGATTAILAYATYISGVSDKISNASANSLPENPMGSLTSMNPLAAFNTGTTPSEGDDGKSDSIIESLNPMQSSEKEPEPEPEQPTTGGKKRRKKTPRSKSKKHTDKKKTIKRKK